jgi:type IV pilus assembly protein PilP
MTVGPPVLRRPAASAGVPTGARTAAAPRYHRLLAVAAAALLAAGLSGCDDNVTELQAWMDETRANAPRRTVRIPEPKRFVPFRYEPRADIDPFSNAKLQVALARFSDRNKGGIAPDLNRRREPLESFPLDTIRLVGHLHRGSTGPVALLEANKIIFQAKVGSYLGQHFGRIVRISETEIRLKEIVQDAAGDWVERDTSLALQESKK